MSKGIKYLILGFILIFFLLLIAYLSFEIMILNNKINAWDGSMQHYPMFYQVKERGINVNLDLIISDD